MSDYKSTLNLPETGFPMRGDLAKREPGMLARWTDDDLYGIIRAAKKGAVIVFVGYSATGEMTLPIGMALDKELTFKTVFRYRNIYPMAIEAVAGGKIRIKDIVTDYFELDDIKNALDSCVHNKADIVKGVIKVC